MKTYKECEIIRLGASDYATLIAVGCPLEYGENWSLNLKEINFGEDGCYHAYLVDNKDIEIGSHYTKVFECFAWLKIYDDTTCVFQSNYEFNFFEIWRAGNSGMIIRCLKCK